MHQDDAARGGLTRRGMLAAGGAGAATLLAVAGCATYSSAASAPAPPPGPAPAPAAEGSGPADPGSEDAAGSGAAGGGTPLGPTGAVPVGGGKVFTDQSVVVTQPTAGTFAAFDTTCTHAGCTVSSVSGGTINCPCHGSKFRVTDGSVAHGPATRPLAANPVTASGGQLRLSGGH